MTALWEDLRYACRGLRRSPGFAIAAIVLLALGVGANTAVFTIVDAVLLRRPLPYPHPEQLVRLVRGADQFDISVAEYQFWRDHAASLQSAAAYRGTPDLGLETGGSVEWIGALAVTSGFFRTLGITPTLGREFTEEETRPGGPQAIVLTDGLWRRAFGARPDVIGSVARLDGADYIVTGVLPAGFWFPQPADAPADAYVPLRFLGTFDDRGANTSMLARLKPGIGLRQAESESALVTENFLRTSPRYLPNPYRGLTFSSYQEWLSNIGGLRTDLWLLFGAVFLLLLIACSNLAGLLMARLANRSREIGVRLALGASGPRLLRQFLLENAVLSVLGGMAGWLCAAWLVEGLLALMPFPSLPVPGGVHLNQPVLWFTFALAAGMNLLFSFAPLFASSRARISEALKSGGLQSGQRQRARSVLVASQVALSVTLSISAALLIESLYRLNREPLGFSPKGLVTFWTPVSRERRGKPEELQRFNAALLERLRALPGVQRAAAVSTLPFTGPGNFPTQREGHPEQSVGGMEIRRVTPEYFEAMGARILRGRGFSNDDNRGAAPVILVSQSVATLWWGNASPVGDRVVIGMFQGKRLSEDPPRAIVGVVEDAKRLNLKEAFRPTVYVPAVQWDSEGMNWVLRGNFSRDFVEQLRRAVNDIDPRQRVERVKTMDEMISSTTADSRFDAWVFGIFAGVALALMAVGIYGLLEFSIARQTNEIGTRMALGASPRQVLRQALRQGLAPVVFGLIAGLAGALAAARLLESLLFKVRPSNPWSYVFVSALALWVGLLASIIPARRAAAVDPLTALRSE
ncbi:MAG TPA: ABC transporter permease [Bryobacteraceae bacterium]